MLSIANVMQRVMLAIQYPRGFVMHVMQIRPSRAHVCATKQVLPLPLQFFPHARAMPEIASHASQTRMVIRFSTSH